MTTKEEFNNTPVTYEANGKEVKLTPGMIRNYLVQGKGNVSDSEIVSFMQLCKYQGLNPFLNEAYIVKYGSSPASIITSKEAFMKRANANRHYRGLKAGIIVQRGDDIKKLDGAIKLPKDILLGGWAEVHRDDRDVPTTVEVSLEEFSKGQSTWKQMPMNMIRKVAIVNALRESFPEQLGNLYTEDETNPEQRQPKPVEGNESEPTSVTELISNTDPKNEPNEQKIKEQESNTETKQRVQEKPQSPEAKEVLESFEESQKKGDNSDDQPTQEELFPGSVHSKFE